MPLSQQLEACSPPATGWSQEKAAFPIYPLRPEVAQQVVQPLTQRYPLGSETRFQSRGCHLWPLTLLSSLVKIRGLLCNSGVAGGPGYLSQSPLWGRLKMTWHIPGTCCRRVTKYPPAICGQPAEMSPVPCPVWSQRPAT